MKNNLLTVARICGDIKFSINGNNKVSFAVDDVWSNSITQELTSDQGNLYPFHSDSSSHSLGALKAILKNLKVVPYQNDTRFEQYVTPEINTWVNTTLFDKISDTLLEHDTVYEIRASYHDNAEELITVIIKITSNEYVEGIFKITHKATYVGEVKSHSLSEDGKLTLVITNEKGEEETVEGGDVGNVVFFDTFDIENAKFYYTTPEGQNVLSHRKYDFQNNNTTKKAVIKN